MIAGAALAFPMLSYGAFAAPPPPTSPLDASVFDTSLFPEVLLDVTPPDRFAAEAITADMVELDGRPVRAVAAVDPTTVAVSLVIDDGPSVPAQTLQDAQGASVELVRLTDEGTRVALATPSGMQSALTADRDANIARISGIVAGAPDVVPLPELVRDAVMKLAAEPGADRQLVLVLSTPIEPGPMLDQITAVVRDAHITTHLVAAPGLDAGPIAELATSTGGRVPTGAAMVGEMDEVTSAVNDRYRVEATAASEGPQELALTIDGQRFATTLDVVAPAPVPTAAAPTTAGGVPSPSPSTSTRPTGAAAAPTTVAAAPVVAPTTTAVTPREGFGRGVRILVAIGIGLLATASAWFALRRRSVEPPRPTPTAPDVAPGAVAAEAPAGPPPVAEASRGPVSAEPVAAGPVPTEPQPSVANPTELPVTERETDPMSTWPAPEPAPDPFAPPAAPPPVPDAGTAPADEPAVAEETSTVEEVDQVEAASTVEQVEQVVDVEEPEPSTEPPPAAPVDDDATVPAPGASTWGVVMPPGREAEAEQILAEEAAAPAAAAAEGATIEKSAASAATGRTARRQPRTGPPRRARQRVDEAAERAVAEADGAPEPAAEPTVEPESFGDEPRRTRTGRPIRTPARQDTPARRALQRRQEAERRADVAATGGAAPPVGRRTAETAPAEATEVAPASGRSAPDEGWITVGELRMCAGTGEVWSGKEQISLSPTELAVLELLMRSGGQGVTSEAIIEAAQLQEGTPEFEDPDLLVNVIRRKTKGRGRGAAGAVRKERVLLYYLGDDEGHDQG